LKAFDFARAVCRVHAAAIAADPKGTKKQARDVAAAKTVAAVERLARSDRGHATELGDWDNRGKDFNTPNKKEP
jgi:putative DNA primase/helicase